MARRADGQLIEISVPGFAGRVHVREDGPGEAPALVLLHGFSGSLRWFDLVVPVLARQFRLVRLDLLGHGATGGRGADAPVQAAVVEAVLAHLDVRDAVAVGHSFGADIAVELAERSDRVAGLVVVTQAPDYSDATFPRGATLMTKPVLSIAVARGIQALALGLTGVAAIMRNRFAIQAMRDVRSLDPAMFRVVLAERRARLARRPLDAQIRDAGVPTLVILGGRDHFYGARSRPRYESAGARVVVLPDAGHSPLVEDPGPAAALIRDFAAEAVRP
jgi:pimeloyl-ACP methyl ester carboxylesterase